MDERLFDRDLKLLVHVEDVLPVVKRFDDLLAVNLFEHRPKHVTLDFDTRAVIVSGAHKDSLEADVLSAQPFFCQRSESLWPPGEEYNLAATAHQDTLVGNLIKASQLVVV